MKKANFIYIYTFLLLFLQNVNGGLVKEFIESVHEKAHKVRDDIRGYLHPEQNIKNKETASIPNNADNYNHQIDDRLIFVLSTTASPEMNNEKRKSDIVQFERNDQNVNEEKIVFFSSPTTPPPTSTTTQKEGRENFFGGCSTGFKRTADGRCKPTF